MNEGIEIFLSYAHSTEDEELLDELEKHLSEWKRQKLIGLWHDRDIRAGEAWQHTVDIHLNTAQIILLLISPDFMASDYCNSVEVKQAMKRHASGDARVIPVILRPVVWQDAPFGKLSALPRDTKPITLWENRDFAFRQVAQGIKDVVNDFALLNEIDQEIEDENINTYNKQIKQKRTAVNRSDVLERKYILVSCAEEDEEIARTLVYKTKLHSGINSDLKWIYQTNLKSNRRMRDVIRRAFAILLVVSSHSRTSLLVETAIQAARNYECPICSVWIAGTSWRDCLPTSAPISLEPIDYRKGGEGSRIRDVLSLTIADCSPIHILLRVSPISWSLPDYIIIGLGDQLQNHVAIKYDFYPSFQEFLDDLYLRYLKDRYPPFTYGKKWILIENSYMTRATGFQRLALPWDWLLRSQSSEQRTKRSIPETFSFHHYLSFWGKAQWQVSDMPSVFGIATQSHFLAQGNGSSFPKEIIAILPSLKKAQHDREGKATLLVESRFGHRGGRAIHIQSVSPEEVDPHKYPFLMPFTASDLDDADYNRSAFSVDMPLIF